jgi:hypothetical protein
MCAGSSRRFGAESPEHTARLLGGDRTEAACRHCQDLDIILVYQKVG